MDETSPLGRRAERRVLGGRYVLRGLLGSGGMADVELAHDEVLDRLVAVKILHSRYADDPSFIERFKREARTAASLNHPNMVAVYDTGESDGRPFIVMEYVAGRTLRDVLRTEGVLPHRAMEITRDTALALHAAHERGLIHRDVKPANIMISDEGVVKVTDFGIARAVGAETVTQTAAVFGTAAYIAPEQAQGQAVDARTDIYALGVVLYEMLAGRPPFSADTPVALAYKHIAEEPMPLTRLNAEITPATAAVVAKAMAKSPEDRYATARAFADDVERAAKGLPVVAPAALTPTQAIRTADSTAYMTPPPPPVPVEEERRGMGAAGWIFLILLLLALAALVWWLFLRTEPVEMTTVPRLIGRDVQVAQRLLRERELEPEIVRVEHPTAEQNVVINQNPPAQTEVDVGSVVTLRVSDGPRLVEVPQVRNLPENEAIALIQDAELSLGERQEERSDDIEEGSVIGTSPPAGDMVEVGTAVDFVVSDGPATVVIPEVRGARADEAESRLRNSCSTPPCLEVETTSQFDDEVEEGRAIGTDPGPGERVGFGSTVLLVISEGPEPEPSPSPEPPEPSPTPSPAVIPPPTETVTD